MSIVAKLKSMCRHYGVTVFTQASFVGLTAYTGVLAARLLGPTGRGELAAIVLWPSMLTFFLAFGVNQAIVFQATRAKTTLSETFTGGAIVGIVQSAILVVSGLLIVPIVLHSYSSQVRHFGIVFALCAPAILVGGYPANMFQAKGNMFGFNLIRLLPTLVYACVLTVLVVTSTANLGRVIAAQLIGFVACAVTGWMWVRTALKPRWAFSSAAIKGLVTFGGKAQVSNISSYVNQRFDQLVLSLLVPPEQVGFYAVAVTASSVVGFLPSAVGMVTLSAAAAGDFRHARHVISRSFRVSLLWLIGGCATLFVLCPALIKLFFGPAFSGSILACRILMPGMIATSLCQVLYNGVTAMGKPALPSYAEGTGLVVTAVGLSLLIPVFGYVGAAIVSTCAYWTSLVVMLVLFKAHTGIPFLELLFTKARSRSSMGDSQDVTAEALSN